MTVYPPRDLVLAVARGIQFVREEPKNSNKGQGVEAMLKATGLGPGYPWCAAMVAFVGLAALGKDWPLPHTASCAKLGEAAAKLGILSDTPRVGDVFLLWYPSLNRFAHTGFIVGVHTDGRCDTIEGNTNQGNSREGWGVFERTRTFGPQDRFIHWEGVL